MYSLSSAFTKGFPSCYLYTPSLMFVSMIFIAPSMRIQSREYEKCSNYNQQLCRTLRPRMERVLFIEGNVQSFRPVLLDRVGPLAMYMEGRGTGAASFRTGHWRTSSRPTGRREDGDAVTRRPPTMKTRRTLQPCGGEWSTPRKPSVGTSTPLLGHFEPEINGHFGSISVSFSPRAFKTYKADFDLIAPVPHLYINHVFARYRKLTLARAGTDFVRTIDTFTFELQHRP
ncbi:hypothetical protein V8D89_001223 [Ganoderma adspersum]